MPFDLIPRSFFARPFRSPAFFDEDEDWSNFLPASGLTVSEDDKNVYVEAAVPGLDAGDVEATYDKGVLWIRGSRQEAEKDKQKKFYRKASSSFSYHVSVPGNLDEKSEPQTTYKNGVVKVAFAKVPQSQPKKLTVKKE